MPLQKVSVNNSSGALSVLDSHGLPFSNCAIAKKGRVSVTIAWTPRRVHFLEESLELVLHSKRSIQIQCNGTAVPNFCSSSPDENSQPNLVSSAAGLCVDTMSMRSGSESSGTACTSPSARMQRVQSRMRRSLSHIHEAFDDQKRSCSRTRSISREPSAEPFNRRASIGVTSECSIGSRWSLSSSTKRPSQPRLSTPQIQTSDALGRRASLSSQSMQSIGGSAERREVRSRPQSARSVSAVQNRGPSATGRAPSVRSTSKIHGAPTRTMSNSTERKPASQSRRAPMGSSGNSSNHLSAESLKKLSASLSPSKNMPPRMSATPSRASRGLGKSIGYHAQSSGAPSLPVRNSRASSLRSTIHQLPSSTPRHKEQTQSFAIYHTECALSTLVHSSQELVVGSVRWYFGV